MCPEKRCVNEGTAEREEDGSRQLAKYGQVPILISDAQTKGQGKPESQSCGNSPAECRGEGSGDSPYDGARDDASRDAGGSWNRRVIEEAEQANGPSGNCAHANAVDGS